MTTFQTADEDTNSCRRWQEAAARVQTRDGRTSAWCCCWDRQE